MSQSPNMIKGDLPPNSNDTFLILLTAALIRTKKFEWTLDNIRIEKIISAPILAKKLFLEVSALLAARHCPKL